ncbi:MAG TPA: sulfite exporter TauE/SafE family protein [Puia sp.]|nr:sulfite exporter TauE/SafE family protein [Puia sp.]
MTTWLPLFYVLLFIVAFLYASVGHGGASGYLALMALFNFSPAVMKPTALLLNLFVSMVSFIQFHRGKYFRWKLFVPLVIFSIPMAFLGGMVAIKDPVYKTILGLFLIIPICRFLFFKNTDPKDMKPANLYLLLIIGAAIGFVSGMIGIGGGIILSPILLLLKWTNQKQTAAISALFIFVNSVAGLAGQYTKGIEFSTEMLGYVAVAFAGGLCGAYMGSLKFPQTVLKNLLAFVLMIAAWKLLWQ